MINKKDVEHVAALARIEINAEEKEKIGKQLSKIIDYIDKLKELDTEGVEPMRGLHIAKNVFRSDKAKDSGLQQDILDNAPLREGNHIKIPKVIE